MRRFPALVLLCASAAFAGAARPTPTPSPVPATPAPMQYHTTLPLVVVFPFEVSNDLRAGSGQGAAQVFTQQMNAEGGVDTIEGPPTVKRADYLKYAGSINAAYYVSGYMTPLGNGVSLVEQVVSVRTGTILFGQTAQIESIQDATAQATLIHDGIVAREQQLADAYTQAQAQATPTPAGSNTQADLTKSIAGIAGLFHRNRTTATATPAPAKPSKGVLVASATGPLPASDLAAATQALYQALDAHFKVRMTRAQGETVAKSADALCGADRNNTIATGSATASTVKRGLAGSRVRYTFVLQMYTCFGAKLAESTGSGDSLRAAVQSAVAAYAADHPQNA